MDLFGPSSEYFRLSSLPVVDVVFDHTSIDGGKLSGVGCVELWEATVCHPLTQPGAELLDGATSP